MKLDRYIITTGTIRCDSGLRIGGSKDSLEIGAIDNPIIRHPISGLPYLPGSSIKGKMRSLLEISSGKYETVFNDKIHSNEGKPCSCAKPDCIICKLFGCGNPKKAKEITRLIFRDAMLTPKSETILRNAQAEKGISFAETKNENWNDRLTGKAGQGGIRTQERVPEGTQFKFEISLRFLEGDNLDDFRASIVEGLSLMQQDYLGGSGTRGYGKISFIDPTFDGQPISGFEVTPQEPETSAASTDITETDLSVVEIQSV